jgi:hypothetical protein
MDGSQSTAAPDAEEAARTGRPSTYDKATADAILMGMAVEELSLRHACASVRTETYPNGVPPGTFCGWVVDDHDGLADRYMRARRIKAHGLIDEMIDIADDAEDDFIETIGKAGQLKVRFNKEAVARSSLRVQTRQWALARMLRNEFGEKLQVDGTIAHDFVAGARERLIAKLGGAGPAPGAEAPAAAAPPSGKAD